LSIWTESCSSTNFRECSDGKGNSQGRGEGEAQGDERDHGPTLELVRHLNCRLENICEDVGALGQVAKLREHLAVQCVANRRLLEEKASLGRRILDLQKEVAELKAAPVVRGERRRDLLEAARPFIAETDIAQQKPNGVAR
jgi:hypothetical protein